MRGIQLHERRRDQHGAQIKALHEQFLVKNREYGDAISATGVLGSVVALTGDVARLRELVLRKQGHGRLVRDNVRDKLMDVANQAIIGLIMLEEDNWEGSK